MMMIGQLGVCFALSAAASTGDATPGKAQKLESDWGRAPHLFKKEIPREIWNVQGARWREEDGTAMQKVLVFTDPLASSARVCRSGVIDIETNADEYIDDLLRCKDFPCRAQYEKHVAVKRPNETTPCGELSVSRYHRLDSMIEELVLVQVHDIFDCLQRWGGKTNSNVQSSWIFLACPTMS